MKIIAKNKKAFHNFEILEKIEAGLSLAGSEVKSLRQGDCSIAEAHVRIFGDEAFIIGMTIPPYKSGGYANHASARRRKLLLHKREILKLRSRMEEKGFTIIPLALYFSSRGIAKVEIGLARGRKLYDKREVMKNRDMKREMESASRRVK